MFHVCVFFGDGGPPRPIVLGAYKSLAAALQVSVAWGGVQNSNCFV